MDKCAECDHIAYDHREYPGQVPVTALTGASCDVAGCPCRGYIAENVGAAEADDMVSA